MKFFAALVIVLLVVGLSPARAQNADDQYLIIYSLLQQADTLSGSGDPRQALAQYTEVQNELEKFQNIFPDWNPKIVNFRLHYVAGKIAETEAKLPTAVASAPTNSTANASAQISTATNGSPQISDAGSDAETLELRGQLQQLQLDNAALTAKLKEALAVQPAAVDPQELVKAQAQIQSLTKENDLLKADLVQVKSDTNNVEATAELVKAQEQVQSLTKENDLLKMDMAQARTNTVLDTNAMIEVQAALAEANKKLADQTARADKLASDNAALQTRVQSLLASPGAMEALHEENVMLKSQLADLQSSSATNLPEIDRLNSDLKQARLQIATLQSDTQVKQLEKAALENRIEQLKAATNAIVLNTPSDDQTVNLARIRALTQERDDLLSKLGEANKELYGHNKQDAAARINELTDEIKTLRARIAVDEAQAVPYTPEELAFFKQAPPQLANPDVEKKSINELPAGSAELVAEAQNYFSAKQYDKAAADYQKILQRDENNSLVLGNLAAIEMEQGKLDDAEKHINAAIAQSPDDAYNLSTLGYLKFRQEKYDEAFDALSRAAKLDPQNPEIENYLGVTLSHKGLRVQAETALRKAIELDPNYAAAHNNLAVIYLSEQPPLVQLARWHYQKALDAGQPHNLELEKAMDAASAPPSPQ